MFEGKAVREQGEKLVAMLETMVNGLGDIPVLKPLIDALARRHAHFDVVEDMFPFLGEALIWTFKKILENEFKPEHEQAWKQCYSLIASWMIAAINEEYRVIKKKKRKDKTALQAKQAATVGGNMFACLRLCRN
mmetsp:Transcript_3307/g.6498  ORF Transcript_3307/g.6498 Transcript_3307/m.6498 type:complete len:134 (-) Transcript_3307:518-919(-)